MTGLDVLLAVAGVTVTMLVIAGMILMTPRGQVEVTSEVDEQPGPDLRPNPDASRTHSDPPRVALGETRGQ